jgi:hypothetical protein
MAVMALVPAAYGSVHLAALSIMFPTFIERLLWKISCYILIGFAGASGALSFLFMILLWVLERRTLESHYLVNWLVRWMDILDNEGVETLYESTVSKVIIALVMAPYVSARLYVVVESFVSLRHVPIGVFVTPDINFMNYVPHL